MRPAVDALDAVLLERRHVGKSGWRLGPAIAIMRSFPALACGTPTRVEREVDDPAEQVLSAPGRSLYRTWFSFTLASR